MSPAYVVRITPADVGRRVSVRSRLPAEAGEPSTTDTVGRLLEWSGEVLTIRKRDGSEVQVVEADMLAGKVIPEAPERHERSRLRPDDPVEGP